MIFPNDASPAGLSTGVEALDLDGVRPEASDIEVRAARNKLEAQLFGAAAPTTIERYVVLRKLGAGGMGIVYAAYDPELDREVAIKVLRAGDTRRLVREAEALAKLTHPNVVQVFAIGIDRERPFIVMELVPGTPLDRWQHEDHSVREILELYLQAGEGLAAAHAAALVHRDFKPQNVLVGSDGRPRVLDFGLARVADVQELALLATQRGSGERPSAIGNPITHRGAVLGTLAYMAPEQFRGEEATALADQYAFCLSLWEAVYGTQPFPTDSVARMMTAREDGELGPPPMPSSAPRWLRAVLARGLAPKPSDRHPTMRTLLDEIRRRRDRSRRRVIAAAGAVVGAGGLALLVAPRGLQPCDPDPTALAGAWDPPRREAVRAAVLATAIPSAEAVARTIGERLDTYAAVWTAARTEACEATRVRGEQSEAVLDRRMGCLQRRRVELAALTDVLAHADALVAANATSAIGQLLAPATCDDPSASTIDPALAPELEAIRSELAAVTALAETGKHEEAIAAGEPLLSRANRSGSAQIRGEVLFAVADVQHRLGREEEADTNFREAYLAATESGDDALAVASATGLLETLVVSPRAREEADHWRRIAETAAARLPDAAALREELLVRYGRILQLTGAVAEARDVLEEAVALRKQRAGPRDPSLRFALSYLGLVMMEDGDAEAARPIHAEAISIAEETLGPQHTDVARLLMNAAGADALAGDLDAAKTKLERALANFEAVGSGHGYDAGTAEMNLALTYAFLEDPPQAVAHARRGVEILAEFPGDPKHAGSLGTLAQFEMEAGEPKRALATVERALALFGDEVNERSCQTHGVAAAVLLELGEMERMEREIEEFERCDVSAPMVRIELLGLWCLSTKPERAQPHIEEMLAQDHASGLEIEQRFPGCLAAARDRVESPPR